MENRIRALGVLSILVGLLGALSAFFFFRYLGGAAFESEYLPVPGTMIAGWMLYIAGLTVPYLIGGIGLILLQPWARNLSVVVLTCGFLSVPFGSLLGLYGLWLLATPDADQVFSPRFSGS